MSLIRCSNCHKLLEESEFISEISGKIVKKCKKCREYFKQYYNENTEKIKEYKKKYYNENTEKIKEYHKQYCNENTEKIKEYHKQYYNENTEKIKENNKQYYSENTEKIKEYKKKYYNENTEKIKEYKKNKVLFSKILSYIDTVLKEYKPIEKNGYLKVKCKKCGKYFFPTNLMIELLFFKNVNLYCSERCKKLCPLYHKKESSYLKENNLSDFSYERDDVYDSSIREMILDLDEHKCAMCGKTNVPLVIHHIKPVKGNEILASDVDNLITLCEDCHKLVHQQQGCTYGDLANLNCNYRKQ